MQDDHEWATCPGFIDSGVFSPALAFPPFHRTRDKRLSEVYEAMRISASDAR